MDSLDPAEQQYLLKKLWCHGQLFAPIQGLFVAVFSYHDRLRGFNFFYAISAVPLLTVWSWASWRCMNSQFPPSKLVTFGLVLEVYYIGLLSIVFPLAWSSTVALFVLVITGMQIMETAAYLAMVNYLKNSITPTGFNSSNSNNNTSQLESVEPGRLAYSAVIPPYYDDDEEIGFR